MTNLPSNLGSMLKAAGLTVVEIDGWRTRGRPASTGGFNPVGVLNHHTGGYDGLGDPEDDKRYAEWMFKVGRSDLPAPLCQLALSAEGVVYLGAAGRANHAGTAKPSGSVAGGDGNSLYVGIEWMLSGTQPIPKKMYDAGAKLNAVLLKTLGSSVQAVSCHYQTSVTGKWDIGDPDGVPFKGAKVLDVPKFRRLVQQFLNAEAPVKTSKTLKIQHTSMQSSDSDRQMKSDIEKLFSRNQDLITGTEAGGPKAEPMPALLEAAGRKHGYRVHVVKDGWVAVKESLIAGSWKTGFVDVVSPEQGAGQHSGKGITWASFRAEDLGRITIGSGHYLTNGRKPGDPNYAINRRYAQEIGDWAREHGKGGQQIVFYCGDQNIDDKVSDTFFGQPLTSAWDELDKYEGTGHGRIDVISSFNWDGRVRAQSIRALDDSELHLHTDHFLVEAVYTVRKI